MGGRDGKRAPKGVLGEGGVDRSNKFSGTGWEHWSFIYKCAIKSVSAESRTAAGTGTREVSLEDVGSLTDTDGEYLEKTSRKSYNDFCPSHEGGVIHGGAWSGERQMHRGVERDTSEVRPVNSGEGAGLAEIMRVMFPGKVKTHFELLPKIKEWQARVDAFSRDHGEPSSDNLKIAALVQMLPGDIRDVVPYRSWCTFCVMGRGRQEGAKTNKRDGRLASRDIDRLWVPGW